MTNLQDSEEILENACGLFSWRPAWLQKFLSRKLFILLFTLLGVSQSMIFSYLSVVLSTIEKQFGVKSAEIAWIYSGNEISQICFVLFLPFIGRTKKRPLWIGLASIISGFGMLLIAMPYFAGRGQDALKRAVISVESVGESYSLCQANNTFVDNCDSQGSQKDWISIGIIFVGIFIVGIGSSSIYSFGIPYIDDNSEKKNSPLSLSLAMISRILGPAFGNILGSFTLRIFANPGENHEGLNEDNPLWVGAWWLGFVIVGCIVLSVAPLMTLFPSLISPPNGSQIDAEDIRRRLEKEVGPSTAGEWWMEFFNIVKRLFTNKVYVFNVGSSVFSLMAIVGFAQFLPKYIEFVFRKRASTSGLDGPVAFSIAAIIGVIVSGIIISKFRPRARLLGAWPGMVMITSILSFAIISQIGCAPLKFYGEQSENSEILTFNNLECNSDCKCSQTQYEPICSVDGKTHYFSPCQAGCKDVKDIVTYGDKNQTIQEYSACSCVLASAREEGNFTFNGQQGLNYALSGFCPSDCSSQYNIVLFLMFIYGLFAGTERLPNTLILLRAIDKRDKAAAMTVLVTFVSAFALLPSPVIFGGIYDRACTIWAEKCGEVLNCLVYNTDKIRVESAIIAIIFSALALCCDSAVCYFVKGLNIYEDGNDESFENGSDTTISTYHGT